MSCNSVPLLAFYLYVSGRALADPSVPDWQTVLPRRSSLPCPTAPQEAQSPGLTATTLPDGAAVPGPCLHCAPCTPQLWGAQRATPPPLCLAPTPSPSEQLAALARDHTRPTPPPTCPTEGGGIGLQNLTLHRWSDCDPLQGPRRPSPPVAAPWTPYQGALKLLPSAVRVRGRGLLQPPTPAPLDQPGRGAVVGRGSGPCGAGQRRGGILPSPARFAPGPT